MEGIEWIVDKCFLVLFVVISVSLFVVISKTEIAEDNKRLDESFDRLEKAGERRLEFIINS